MIKPLLRIFLFSLYLISPLLLTGQTSKKIPSNKPKLIVGIIVSQFRQDYIARYWDAFSEDGFKKLTTFGSYCKNTSFSYVNSEKGVGTATIVTGANPSGHGIIGSSWYNDLRGKTIPAIYDEKAHTIGGPYEAGKCSPYQLLGTTVGDELNLTNKFQSKIIGISLEPSSAVISTGHTGSSAYWFDVQKGNFISSSFYQDSLPQWVQEFNAKELPKLYMEKTWNTLLPIGEYKASLPDDNPYEEGFRKQITFPYEIKDIAKSYKKNERLSIMNTTPFGDNLVKDFAIQAIVNEEMGMDEFTDILFLNFTALEQIGNLYGPLSVEVEDAVLRLDKEIAHFLSFLEDAVGIENTLIFFTSEHGLPYTPDYLKDHKIPSGYFSPTSAISLLSSYLNNIYGKGDWVKHYQARQIYLNRSLIESADLSLSDVQENVAELMLQFHGVKNTLTGTSLINTNFTEGEFRKIQNGYNQKRSGDVIINLQHGFVEKQGKMITSSGTDSRVPLIFYGWKMKRKTITAPVDLIDIAPTLSTFLDISYPNISTGKPIEELVW